MVTTIHGTLLPPKLQKGQTIGLIAPASYITHYQLQSAIDTLHQLGYKTKYSEGICNRWGYFSDTDIARAIDFNRMFSDTEVNAIFCVRGGYGCSRILEYLDYNLIKQNPKIVVGFSDITALHIAIYKNTGLVGFHAVVGMSDINDYTRRHLLNVLENPVNNYVTEYEREADGDSEVFDCYTIIPGIAQGVLVGGNLSLLASLVGTPWDIDYKNKLVFIEEIDEKPYRVDRMLTQLLQSGKFEHAAGVLLGVFDGCDIDGDTLTTENSFTLKQVIVNRMKQLNIPVLYGFSFGHVQNKCTLPVGIEAVMDTENRKITFLEKAVY